MTEIKMYSIDSVIYAPVLREKGGEIEGARRLHEPLKRRMLPIWVAMPQDPAKPLLGPTALARREVGRVQSAWGSNVCLWDPSHLRMSDEPARDAYMLSAVLKAFLRFGCRIVPLANLRDTYPRVQTMADHSRRSGSGLAVRVSIDDFDEVELIQLFLSNAKVSPTECVLVLDLGCPDAVDVDDLAASLAGWVRAFDKLGRWRKVVVNASSFPLKNPAPKIGGVDVARHEWALWLLALKTSPELKDRVVFGDYGADCVVKDLSGGGIPIPHIRYADASGRWRVERTDEAARMRTVMQRIANADGFFGRHFSAGDEYIEDCAVGSYEKCGDATRWRFANMNHHFTVVLKELSLLLGLEWEERTASTERQESLAV
jgi:hypothetical protein